VEDLLTVACRRLESDGFSILENVSYAGKTYPVVARRSRFELSKFGFSESFFIFREFESLTKRQLWDFSDDAYSYAKQHKTIPLPCGVFESVWSYAIAIAQSADEEALTSVECDSPPKHWSSAEIPAVYDLSREKVYYFKQTPMWGAVYYDGFRRQVLQILGDHE
jgi:hypothetical protein